MIPNTANMVNLLGTDVHGIMNGEAIQEQQPSGISNAAQDFEIH